MEGIFYKTAKEYNKKLDIHKEYLTQLKEYIKVTRKCTEEKAIEVAKKIFKLKFQDRNIKYFYREENGDQIVANEPLSEYIMRNVREENIMVPTFTAYQSPKYKKSILSEFISHNVVKRAAAKKEGQAAEARGDYALAASKNNEQNNMKTYNNALSGIFGLSSCILHNPTAHSALTSVTRTTTSTTNASNERLIAGNRYLPRQEDAIRSIVYEAANVDQDKVKLAVDKFNLHIPTVDELVEVLKRSTDLYWRDEIFYRNKIIPFMEGLTDMQRVGIAYSGDMYHLRKYNNTFVKVFFDKILTKLPITEERMEDHNELWKIPEVIRYYVHSLYFNEIKGKGKEYDKYNETGLAKAVYDTCLNTLKVLDDYADYFRAFFLTDIIAYNAHRLRHMRRRAVPLSDTDSSGYTVDEWVEWDQGEFLINERSVGLASAMAILTTSNLVHRLATVSMNMGIGEENIFKLAFKNEYLWSSFATADVSKHYYSLTMIVEGNVLLEPKLDTKGVHLKNSAVPYEVIGVGEKIMTDVSLAIYNNQKVKLSEIVRTMIAVEEDIISSLKRGEGTYLKRTQVKDETAYNKGPLQSPYQHYTLWCRVFEDKYGRIDPPPYGVLKIPTVNTSKTALKAWVDSIQDVTMRNNLDHWLKEHNKSSFPTMYISRDYISSTSIPEEIVAVLDVEKVVLDLTLQLRIILGTLGVMLTPNVMIKDQLDPDTIAKGSLAKPAKFIWKGNGYKGPGYVVNTKGDKRFSPYVAKIKDYTIEQLYQGVVKGYGLDNWQEGKGKPTLRPEVDPWDAYLKLYKMWAIENPELIAELRVLAAEKGGVLVDFFATEDINQARALCEILNNGATI